MCGSQFAYDEALQDGCNLVFKKDDVIKKTFDIAFTFLTNSTRGNVKIASIYPEQIVILTDAEIISMGFANRIAFVNFFNSIKSSCTSNSAPKPVYDLTIEADLPHNTDETYSINVAEVMAAKNYVLNPIDIPNGLSVTMHSHTDGQIKVFVVNNTGDVFTDEIIISLAQL